ncbi:MAG: hypothetical protein O3A53_08170 [Acidobacteria bacterium]|nr:hypothetical protein [Acidobacteriota bacterium]MDA1234762.1 hypothetical protein [Acidobacteriota bacterium]
MLFDLSEDITEETNLIDQVPDVAKRLESQLNEIRANGRSR